MRREGKWGKGSEQWMNGGGNSKSSQLSIAVGTHKFIHPYQWEWSVVIVRHIEAWHIEACKCSPVGVVLEVVGGMWVESGCPPVRVVVLRLQGPGPRLDGLSLHLQVDAAFCCEVVMMIWSLLCLQYSTQYHHWCDVMWCDVMGWWVDVIDDGAKDRWSEDVISYVIASLST